MAAVVGLSSTHGTTLYGLYVLTSILQVFVKLSTAKGLNCEFSDSELNERLVEMTIFVKSF